MSIKTTPPMHNEIDVESYTPASPRPFPFDRGEMPVEQYFLRLLLALVVAHKGELRISAGDVLNIDPKSALLRTVDSQRGEIVLRFGSKHSEMYFVPDDTPPVNRAEAGKVLRWSPRLENPELLNPLPPVIPTSAPELSEFLTGNRIEQDEDMTKVGRHQVMDDLRQFLTETRIKENRESSERSREMVQRNRSGSLPYRTAPKPSNSF